MTMEILFVVGVISFIKSHALKHMILRSQAEPDPSLCN